MTADVLQVRLDDHARRLAELERTQPAVIGTQVQELRADVQELRDEVRANKRAQWSLAVSILAGAITLALTALQISGTG